MAGKRERIFARAFGPPVEEPITTKGGTREAKGENTDLGVSVSILDLELVFDLPISLPIVTIFPSIA